MKRPGVLVLAAALVAAISGCTPAPSALSDPREILAQATQRLGIAKTVHLDAVIDATVALAALAPGLGLPGGGGLGAGGGTGARSGSVALTGSHASGDLDLADRRAALKLEVPALLGLTAELREVDGASYATSSLTAPGWHRLDGSDAGVLGNLKPLDAVAGLRSWLARPGLVPTRLDDASCAAGRCYVLRITGSGADVGGTGGPGGGFLGSGLAIDQVTVELRIAQDTLRLSEVVLTLDAGSAGSVKATVALTGWDDPVTVVPPPSNQIG